MLPRPLVSLDVSAEEGLDHLNKARHRFSLWVGDVIPYWAAGITRADAYNAQTRVVEVTRRFDGSALGSIPWLELELPPNAVAVYAVHVRVGSQWRGARPSTPRFINAYAHSWLVSPYAFTPLYTAGSSALSDSLDWLRVSAGQQTLAPEQIEVWYGRAYDYLEIGDDELQAPDWAWGMLVLEAWMTLLLKHLPNPEDNIKGIVGYFRSVADLLETVRMNSMVRLRKFSAVVPSLLERNIVYNYGRSQ